ncbi:MraZ protein [Sulfurivirga caldicuralii]|uniref:Transcriptional regulator MraZ n=1 Tax=Sulfurivirga caldicuralii TaxID=364032 RepID=A0A1N6DV31_9GAMM|nr:division/cell wall cluster transcriptional repressor MraZ [Sulfurivirga caldicuralii]SIN74632.1 MraZ protein [Sulfurivirga caldicuralii]
MFFRGLHQVNLDQKGRLAIPKRIRDAIAQSGNTTLVATIDLQSPCLLLYPFEEWKHIEQKIMALPNIDPTARRYQRLFVGFAHELDMDGQGRVLVPSVLREHVDLEKQAVLLGQGNKLELWPQARWDETCPAMLEDVQNEPVPEVLTNLSI